MSVIEDFRRTPEGKIIQGARHTSYILNHEYRNKAIMTAYSRLKNMVDDFDTIACCGISGIMVVPQIAELLRKNILIVRKNVDGYSKFILEGAYGRRYIIIDDLICSGSTCKYITRQIKEEIPGLKCLGIYTYMKEDCAYSNCPDLCMRDLRIPYL